MTRQKPFELCAVLREGAAVVLFFRRLRFNNERAGNDYEFSVFPARDFVIAGNVLFAPNFDAQNIVCADNIALCVALDIYRVGMESILEIMSVRKRVSAVGSNIGLFEEMLVSVVFDVRETARNYLYRTGFNGKFCAVGISLCHGIVVCYVLFAVLYNDFAVY